MSKVIAVDYEKCVSCVTCKLVCSAKQEGEINLTLSRIDIVQPRMGIEESIPVVCQQCQSAPCMAICPVNAISRDEELGRVIINQDFCIGCRMCVAICPFGCMTFHSSNRKVFKCTLCDGDPMCVKFCQHGALQYIEADEQGSIKRLDHAEKFSGIMHKVAEAIASV
ncbi:4Fe-4S dicluster domain-containing protein [Chloroflexota bacterium]